MLHGLGDRTFVEPAAVASLRLLRDLVGHLGVLPFGLPPYARLDQLEIGANVIRRCVDAEELIDGQRGGGRDGDIAKVRHADTGFRQHQAVPRLAHRRHLAVGAPAAADERRVRLEAPFRRLAQLRVSPGDQGVHTHIELPILLGEAGLVEIGLDDLHRHCPVAIGVSLPDGPERVDHQLRVPGGANRLAGTVLVVEHKKPQIGDAHRRVVGSLELRVEPVEAETLLHIEQRSTDDMALDFIDILLDGFGHLLVHHEDAAIRHDFLAEVLPGRVADAVEYLLPEGVRRGPLAHGERRLDHREAGAEGWHRRAVHPYRTARRADHGMAVGSHYL